MGELNMKKLVLSILGFALVSAMLFPSDLAAQRRRVVVRRPVAVRRPVVRTPLVVHRAYPIRRVLPSTVVVRPARRVVPIGAPLVFLPAVNWTLSVTAMPTADRLVWQDSEHIEREKGWVDTNFGVDSSGKALLLDINGKANLNFAEVTFGNGNVQVVDFNEQTHGPGFFRLLDFADGRHVKTVRIMARSESDKSRLAVYLSK